jgi:hypothetical protein
MEGNQTELIVNSTLSEKLEIPVENLDLTANLNSTIIEEISTSEGNGMIYMIVATVLIFLIYKLFCKNKKIYFNFLSW